MKIGEKGLSEITVLKLFSQLLDAYGEVHNKNYVHRDIKP
jgi:serine/threonine protein kinase